MTKPISRQRAWQRKKVAEGCCAQCGKPREAGQPVYCNEHAQRHTERERRRAGSRAWRAGKPGRPPRTVRHES